MIEYKINIPATGKEVKLLWKKFLKNDPHWHFALEGIFFELRTSEINLELEKYLNKRKWSFSKCPYKNGTPITRKYQDCFDDIYHGYALLAMKLPKPDYEEDIRTRDCYRVMERIIHLAFNNFHGLGVTERETLTKILLDRVYMAGYNSSHLFRGYKKK